MSNDTKDTKKKLVFNTWGVVCCKKIVVEDVSNDTKDTGKKLVFITWGVVCCTMIIVEGVSNDTKKYHDLSFAVGKNPRSAINKEESQPL